jgi:MFS superfamily sulfate permease-like transporter
VTDIDVTGGEIVGALNEELEADGVELAFAELKDPVRERLRRYGIEEAIGTDRIFPPLGVAVAAYLEATGTEWLDWEDRASRPSGPRRR